MFVLLALCLLVGGVVVIPLILVALVLRLVLGIALLPIRIAWLLFRLGAGLLLGVCGLIVAAGMFVLIPLLPILLVVGAIWLIVRLFRGRPATRLVAG